MKRRKRLDRSRAVVDLRVIREMLEQVSWWTGPESGILRCQLVQLLGAWPNIRAATWTSVRERFDAMKARHAGMNGHTLPSRELSQDSIVDSAWPESYIVEESETARYLDGVLSDEI